MQRDLAPRATRVILQAQGSYATDPIAILQLPTSVTAARTLRHDIAGPMQTWRAPHCHAEGLKSFMTSQSRKR